jgi:uncharacterized protein
MVPSKHNIISKITDSDNYYIVNVLSQEADILSEQEVKMIRANRFDKSSEFAQKGYIVNQEEETSLYRKRYLEFIDARDTDEIQLFFVLNYTCNFSCSYCYQDQYGIKEIVPTQEVINAFFKYVQHTFSNRKKYITIFGGEPLLNSTRQKELFEMFIEKSNEHNLDIAIVTNGYHLNDYIGILKAGSIRELQVTLDGTKDVHDSRRMLKGKGKTFDKIVEGIDCALESNIPINLRMVLDKDNIAELPKIADFAIKKGWTQSPIFKTQIGRNYELHHCQSSKSRLYSRIDMYKDIYKYMKEFPLITEFHKPAFSVAKFLFEEGQLPDPLFDSCPGTKTEWAFDFTGKIFSCTATVGKPGEELGTFYPEVYLNEEMVSEWEERDVMSIPECSECELKLACGGGCASVAKNNTGKVNSPDCRPVRQLLELGIAHYFNNN